MTKKRDSWNKIKNMEDNKKLGSINYYISTPANEQEHIYVTKLQTWHKRAMRKLPIRQ